MSAEARSARPALINGGAQDVQEIPVGLLLDADSPRLNGESNEHIRMLVALEAPLPPVLVHRDTMRVVDGMHRLRAAMLRGQETIEVKFFEGSQADAFVSAVQANTEHGLPLTLADREAAAARIVSSHPHCSDRWIAAITGLSAGTVGSIRRRQEPDGCRITARMGRDGRMRPLNSIDGRRVASDAITKHPEASLREIARMAGISPATVRDVRERMRRGDDPLPSGRPRDRKRPVEVVRPVQDRRQTAVARIPARSPESLLQNLRKDPSLRLTESGRTLLRWLERRACGPCGWQNFIDAAPPHCAYLIAELARGCAEEWLAFARQLEERLSDHA